jgi:hypothetical protein
VLRAVLSRHRIVPADGAEVSRRRAITLSPRSGSRTVLRERVTTREPVPA